MVLAPLPDTKATLMLSLCALSQGGQPVSTLKGYLLKIGISTLWNFNFAQTLTPYPAYAQLLTSML
eukprot:445407-Pelagomonas_calceolata.AAC.1